MSENPQKNLGQKITPLWIVAAFVTLTETVLGYALTQVTGGVQIALTTFVICFALLVASAFFVILWNRPYVFYPPSEYGDTDPKKFVDAIRPPERIREQRELLDRLSQHPNNAENEFTIIDSLIDDPMRQHIILMHEKEVKIPFSDYHEHKYETGNERGPWASGVMSGKDFAKKLGGTDTIEIKPDDPSVVLTARGHEFARWLVNNNRKAEYLVSSLGGWGTPTRPFGVPSSFFDELQRESDSQGSSSTANDQTESPAVSD